MPKKIIKTIRIVPHAVYVTLLVFSVAINILAFGGEPHLMRIEFDPVVDVVRTIVNFVPDISLWLYNIRAITAIVLLLVVACYLVKLFYRERALIFKHFSFVKQIADYDEKLSTIYRLKVVEIGLPDKMTNINEALMYQDSEIHDALQKTYNYYFYYGIAHTPFIFRAGYVFGDECNVRLLHKKRENSSCFTELKKSDSENLRLDINETSPEEQSNELLVIISTTFEVLDSELDCLEPKSKHQLKFELQSKSFDNLSSYNQLERYRNDIFYAMRNLCKKYEINTIHLVASTSVTFSFFLGQGLSATHDPVVIVYHYDKQNENHKYPWGIKIMNEAEFSLVIT